MRFNRKGDMGFPEAMMAVMVVMIVLTVYLGAFLIHAHTSEDDVPEFNTNVLSGISIENDRVTGDLYQDLSGYVEHNGYRGAIITCCVPGDSVECDLSFSFGDIDGDITTKRFTRVIPSDDDRMIPVVFEVMLCH